MCIKNKIIGGMFGAESLQPIRQPTPHFLNEPCLKLINGRSAIYVLCNILKPSKVWLPSFLCSTMIKAVPSSIQVKYYPIGMDLKVKSMDWVSQLDKDDLAIFIDYFGFDLHTPCMKKVKDKGTWILQDAAQALLSNFERPYADFVLYSPRKTLGVPDGGILHSNCSIDFLQIDLEIAPSEYILKSYNAFISRTIFDQNGEADWYSLYKIAEALSPIGYYKMTDFSISLLSTAFDYSLIKHQRRNNYKKLFSALTEYSIIEQLPQDTVPLGFPAFFKNRNELLRKMYKESIFCPVHWPVAEPIPNNYHDVFDLNKGIITLLCDQRLETSDIQRLISIILETE